MVTSDVIFGVMDGDMVNGVEMTLLWIGDMTGGGMVNDDAIDVWWPCDN